ncbi:MAG: response regulator [Daejeonella sp.]|uniref:response regulator n=1 Tax=Daejeonella sp. TaxID=2805397 RepID=UPI003C75D9DB
MKKQILVVDDEISIHKLLQFILAKDYNLVIKYNGVEALSWLNEGNNPDLIISDLEMPYIDGKSFIRNLKISGHFHDIPVILISGADDLESIVNRMTYKADCFFKKPFNANELKSCITTSLINYELSTR